MPVGMSLIHTTTGAAPRARLAAGIGLPEQSLPAAVAESAGGRADVLIVPCTEPNADKVVGRYGRLPRSTEPAAGAFERVIRGVSRGLAAAESPEQPIRPPQASTTGMTCATECRITNVRSWVMAR